MKQRVLYGGQVAEVEAAASVRGVLLRGIDGAFVFRVYHPGGQFTDYDIRHDDVGITIDADELAAFYSIGDQRILDHSPSVLGLPEVP